MRIAHLSDLHFGRHDDRLAAGLADELRSVEPDLVVVSGDFAQVGSAREFAAAQNFLKSLHVPFMAVPGNHDVPARNLLRRFLAPYSHYRTYIADDLEPFVETQGVALAGLNTSRPVRLGLNWAHGSINRKQLARLEARFAEAAPDALRVVVAHHPLLQPETPAEKPMRLVDRANVALETFARLGVRLVLSGHFHLSYVRRHDAAGAVGTGAPTGGRSAAHAPIIVAQASSTISTRLRGEPNAYNLINLGPGQDTIDISVREWAGNGWITREAAPLVVPTS